MKNQTKNTKTPPVPTLAEVKLFTELASMNLDRDVSIRRSPLGEWWIVEHWGAADGRPDEFRQVTPEWLAKFVLEDFLPDVVPHVEIRRVRIAAR
jgi:hypothetical protein